MEGMMQQMTDYEPSAWLKARYLKHLEALCRLFCETLYYGEICPADTGAQCACLGRFAGDTERFVRATREEIDEMFNKYGLSYEEVSNWR